MKRVNILIITAILIITVVTIFLIISRNKDLSQRVIVQELYLNGAWGFYGEATIICESGDVYYANLEKLRSYSKANSLNDEKMNQYILKYGKKIKNFVSQDKVKEIKTEVIKLNEKLKDNDNGWKLNDAGTTTIKVYNEEKNKFIILSKSGDVQKINTSSNALELKKLINNIINKIDKNN